MNSALTLRSVRARSGLTLRALGRRAGTSHSTLSAYEGGRKIPTVETMDRIVRAAGFELDVAVVPSVGGSDPDARGRELIEALDLAAMFPARHLRNLTYPRFGPAAGR